ncbi:hypothetical protein GW17_00034307 [Ensete ventricosum]|nr:hypothetical protein GW17_00034307 [Ensete ventricosum]
MRRSARALRVGKRRRRCSMSSSRVHLTPLALRPRSPREISATVPDADYRARWIRVGSSGPARMQEIMTPI